MGARDRVCRRALARIAALLVAAVAMGGAAADCGSAATPLAAVRGVGDAPLPAGREVTVEAAVTGSFPGGAGLDGFFVESTGAPRAAAFVYAPELDAEAAPAAGERWRITARTGRYRGRIQLESVSALQRCGSARLEPTPLHLPANEARLAAHRDRLVRLQGELVVTDAWDLARYGSLGLAVGKRRFHPANNTRGGEPAGVVLDDGSYRRSPTPVPHLNGAGTRRLGSEVEAAVGVLTRAFGAWRLHPVRPVVFGEGNRRRPPPPQVGDLRLVNFNLRNYFIDRAGRGPDTAAGFARQRRRLADSLAALDADVLALHELENRSAAVRDLVALLNVGRPREQRYAAAAAALDRGDAVIRSVLLYRPARLTLAEARLDTAPAHDRAPVIAVFRTPAGERLRVAAAHFKSRGGCPQRGDVDRGEGCWAQRRAEQAAALGAALARAADLPTLVLGDLNAYAGERALQPLREAEWQDLLGRHVPPARRYTYVYRGAAGYLDHALANPALARQVAAVAVWHANADEPPFLAARGEGVWRASDHDPVIVDLRAR